MLANIVESPGVICPDKAGFNVIQPWIQQSLRIRNDSSRYRYFYQSVWHNVLILLVIFLANGLTWLVLLLWGELFKLVGIKFFNTLFFATDWFMYLTLV